MPHSEYRSETRARSGPVWLERAAGLGEKVAINTGTTTLEGIFDTIDDTGCLIVRTVDGRRLPVAAGEVFFGSAASVGAA